MECFQYHSEAFGFVPNELCQKACTVKAIIDNGSGASFISEKIVEK